MKVAGRLGHPRPRHARRPLRRRDHRRHALPHLFAFLGGADWRADGGRHLRRWRRRRRLLGLVVRLGPHHARAAALRSGRAPARLDATGASGSPISATSGTCGSSTPSGPGSAPRSRCPSPTSSARRRAAAPSSLTFAAIALGGLLCLPAGRLADRVGKARGGALGDGRERQRRRFSTALAFGGPVWLVAPLVARLGRGRRSRTPRSSPRSSPTPRRRERAGSLLASPDRARLHA